MKKRTVLIDLRYLKYLTNGFGQLSLYYGNYFLQNPDKYEDLDITLLVPENFVGKFGNHVKYLALSKKYKFFPFLLSNFDICHSITQQIKYTSLSSRSFRIVTIHDLNFLYEKSFSRRRMKKFRARVELADLITVISKFTAYDIERNANIDNIPVVINYNGLKDITKDEEKEPYFMKSDRKFFFTIGQIAPKKNFHVLLDMMKLMPDYDLYICGDDSSEYAKKMQKQVIEEKINNVFITGMIGPEEKVWMYKNCYAFLFPSKFEGFGIPVIDAMRFEKPVFSSRMTSLEEVGDKFAYFWDSFEPGHMSKTIVDNIESFYKNEQLIKDQKDYAFSFTMERHMSTFLNLYRGAKLKTKRNPGKTIGNYINYIKA